MQLNPLFNFVAPYPHIIHIKFHQNQIQRHREETIQVLEINMHHLRGNAIPAGPMSDFLNKIKRGEGVLGT